jgi:hypothetical protein
VSARRLGGIAGRVAVSSALEALRLNADSPAEGRSSVKLGRNRLRPASFDDKKLELAIAEEANHSRVLPEALTHQSSPVFVLAGKRRG